MATPRARARKATDQAVVFRPPRRWRSQRMIRSVTVLVTLPFWQLGSFGRFSRVSSLAAMATAFSLAANRGPFRHSPTATGLSFPPCGGRWPAGPDGGRTTPTSVIPDPLFSDNPGRSRVLKSLPKFNRDLVLFSKWVRFAKMALRESGSNWLHGYSPSHFAVASFGAAVPTWNGFVRRIRQTECGVGFVRRIPELKSRRCASVDKIALVIAPGIWNGSCHRRRPGLGVALRLVAPHAHCPLSHTIGRSHREIASTLLDLSGWSTSPRCRGVRTSGRAEHALASWCWTLCSRPRLARRAGPRHRRGSRAKRPHG
jgi:hypothetical protein